MTLIPNTIQTSEEIIKEAKELFNNSAEGISDYYNEAYFIIGYLKQHYDTLLKSISEYTRDKFIAASDDGPTYEEMAGEEHEEFKEDNSQVHPLFKDIINNSFKI